MKASTSKFSVGEEVTTTESPEEFIKPSARAPVPSAVVMKLTVAAIVTFAGNKSPKRSPVVAAPVRHGIE